MDTFVTLDEIYKKLSDLTHLGADLRAFTPEEFANFGDSDFEKLMEDYVRVLGSALRLQQIYLHTIIDSIVQQKKKRSKGVEEDLKLILNVNLDARQYFYAKADEWWLGWLGKRGFLNVTNESAADSGADNIRRPELQYLLRMAEKRPANVVDILLKLPAYTNTSNQAIYSYLLRICQSLPAHQLARVVEKIRSENWPALLDGIATQTGFEYDRMCETLANAKDYESLLVLIGAALSVRTDEETERASRYRDSPFFLDYLSRTGIFGRLAAVEAAYAEDALALATEVMAEAVVLRDKDGELEGPLESDWGALIQKMRLEQVGASVFEVADKYTLSDMDFFDLELGQKEPQSFQKDVHELAAVVKTLLERLIGERCADSAEAKRIYKKHIAVLPHSRTMWRLRLYALSLCPRALRVELKGAFFKMFEVERHHEITSGAEYEKALQKGFPVLSEDEKQDFVQKTIHKFSQLPENRNYEGSHILSMILPYLEEDPALKHQAEEAGFKLDAHYEPLPDRNWGDGKLKTISSQAPISQEEFGRLTITEIANRLRHAWTPAELNAQNSEADFNNPLNAEGVGDLLKNDIPERLREYVENAGLFFERGLLDQHYTYAYLTGIQEAITKRWVAASQVNWDGVIDLFVEIKDSGEKEPFERGKRKPGWYDYWPANWDFVHSAVVSVLRELLTEQDGLTPIDFGRYRDRILDILGYLLACPDPSPENEDDESLSSVDTDNSVTQLHHLAINSMRGRAFKALILFFVQDGRQSRIDVGIGISADVKRLYEHVLKKESNRALMFLYGYYLPNFYFADRDWIQRQLVRIFPQESTKNQLYTAAWGGFLTQDFYEEVFFDPEIQILFWRSFELPDVAESLRQSYSEPGARLAQHLALAFMHFKEFGFDHQLFRAFWEKGYPSQHAHFVKFLGLSFVSGGNSDYPESERRLRDFWDWLLKKDVKQEAYMEFGTWINLDKGIFEPAWLARRVKQTLEEAGGVLDWDDDLIKICPRLAQAAPEDTLEIARLYLLEGGARDKNLQTLWHWNSDNNWIEAFKILHGNQTTKAATTDLIDDLVIVGGEEFWPLKEILTENP